MIQGGVTSFDRQIDLQKSYRNNFAYRTGAIGGLYLSHRVGNMPFSNTEDHRQSVWELVLENVAQQPQSSQSVADIQGKYAGYSFDTEKEIEEVINYLISTVTDM